MADCSCSYFHTNSAWLQIIQLVPMETRNQPNFLAFLHNFNTRLCLKEVLLAKNINKFRIDFPFLHSLFNSRNLWFDDILSLLSLCFSFGYSMCPTKSTNDGNFIFIFLFSNLCSFQHFYLVFSIETIPWFNLYRSCA